MKEQEIKARPTRQEGYGWGAPCLVVENGEKAIETYTRVFGFSLDNSMKDANGKVSFAKLTYKDFGLHLCDIHSSCCSANQKQYKTPKMLGVTSPVSLYLYNGDVEGMVEKARKHRLKVLQEAEVMFWGDKMCILEDEDGYIWNFAKNVADFDPSKMPS